jgi:hypothetical protein
MTLEGIALLNLPFELVIPENVTSFIFPIRLTPSIGLSVIESLTVITRAWVLPLSFLSIVIFIEFGSTGALLLDWLRGAEDKFLVFVLSDGSGGAVLLLGVKERDEFDEGEDG